MRALLISACVVFAAACSNNPSGSDASTTDASTIPPDASTIPADAATIPPDASVIPPDAGVVPPDAGPSFWGSNDAGPVNAAVPYDTLFVDNDNSDNNKGVANPQMSTSDYAYGKAAALIGALGLKPVQWVVPANHQGDSRPNIQDLTGTSGGVPIKVIVWYTGANSNTSGNGCMSAAQGVALSQWVTLGGRLIVVSENYVHDLVGTDGGWTIPPTDPLLALAGVAGVQDNPNVNPGTGDVPVRLEPAIPFLGNGPGFPVGATAYVVTSPAPPLVPVTSVGIFNAGSLDGGLDTNAVTYADPMGTGNVPAGIVVANKAAGFGLDAGTATGRILFSGIPVENINKIPLPDGGTAGADALTVFTALGQYFLQ